eukprot:749185-Hanusia_phi.AAC.1
MRTNHKDEKEIVHHATPFIFVNQFPVVEPKDACYQTMKPFLFPVKFVDESKFKKYIEDGIPIPSFWRKKVDKIKD